LIFRLAIFSCGIEIDSCEQPVPVPISAFIIVKNEEKRLPRAIAALRPWVDEIVVVDSGSSDRTVDVARAMGAKVTFNAWRGYGPQKGFAERLCRNDWVLNVDADEIVTPELAAEIRAIFAPRRAIAPGAYRTNILTVYPGDLRPRPWPKDYNEVRLYHRSVGAYREHAVFDRVVLRNTEPRQLRQPIFHHSYLSFSHLVEKNNYFSSFCALNSRSRSSAFLKLRLTTEFPLQFLKSYIGRRHISGGWKGFYFALCHAFMRTTRIAKMLELTQGHERPENEDIYMPHSTAARAAPVQFHARRRQFGKIGAR
jgi:glycosyltransferase involved in cell wall biosynthesis